MRYLMIIGFIVGVMATVACERRERPRQEEEIVKVMKQGRNESELIRYEDQELGIVCYRARNYNGLSCIRKNLPQVPQ